MAKNPAKKNRPATDAPLPARIDAVPPEYHAPLQSAPATPPDLPPPAATPAPAPDPEPTPPAPAALARARGGIVLPLLGGAIAGGIGFAIAYLPMRQDADLAQQFSTQLAQLRDTNSAEITAFRGDLDDQVGAISAAMSGQIAALGDRLTALETAPRDVTAPELPAFNAEIDSLRAELAALSDVARAELDSARTQAAAIEENAAAAARDAAARAALSRVQAGIDNGSGFAAALTDLDAVLDGGVPDALRAVQDGVPTMASLQDSFADAARAGLTAARAAGVAGEPTAGVAAFLRNQFNVRSVAPRDGDTTDAVLSRAQAALRAGDIGASMTGLAALPDAARAAMADWLTAAQARADAVAAMETLAAAAQDN